MSIAFPQSEQVVAAQATASQAMPEQGLIQTRVECIRFGTHDTSLYELRPVDGTELPAAQPGAHIAVHLPSKLVRQYSLLQAGEKPLSYLIGVKRDAASRGGSSFIHEKLRVGDRLMIEAPRNNFPLAPNARHTLLLAGGIGITPMLCMWQQLKVQGHDVRLIYSCRSRKDALFLDTLDGEPGVTLRFDDEHKGSHLDMAAVLAGAPADAHLEYFSSAQEQATEGGFSVKLARAGITVAVASGQSVLAALRDCGISTASSCEEGICGACETKVLGGIPDHRDSVLSDGDKLANDRMMICCSGSKTPELVLDL